MQGWIELWSWCHVPGMSGPVRTAWPDGGALLDQPVIVVRVFDLVTEVAVDVARTKEQ